MKKFLILLLMVFSFSFFPNVNAKTEEELLDYMSKEFQVAGKEVKLADSDILKIERYLSEYEVSSSNCDTIIAKIDEVIKIMNKENVSDPTKLSKAKRQEVLTILQEAATSAGASLTYDNTKKVVSIYRDGKLIEEASIKPYKLAQTGTNNTIYIVTFGIVLALGTVGFYRKFKKHA